MAIDYSDPKLAEMQRTQTLALWEGPRMVLVGGSEPFMERYPAALGLPADELFADPMLAGLLNVMREVHATGVARSFPLGFEVVTVDLVRNRPTGEPRFIVTWLQGRGAL